MSELFPNIAHPEIIDPLDFETILSELLADLIVRFAENDINYDVGNLETDPAKILLENGSYQELNLRARANDVAKANILSFSTGSDLDHLAAFYEVTRLVDELDSRLQLRVVEAIKGRSPGGSAHWYRFQALTADIRVKDIFVTNGVSGPEVLITILSTDNGGVADQALIDVVSAELNSDSVKVVSDTLVIQAAVIQTVDVTADVYLLSGQPTSVFDALEAHLTDSWTAEQNIGFDLTISWLTKTLHQPGVQRVEISAPADSIPAESNRAIAIGTVNLTLKGYDF